jgi:hypothetical protein
MIPDNFVPLPSKKKSQVCWSYACCEEVEVMALEEVGVYGLYGKKRMEWEY